MCPVGSMHIYFRNSDHTHYKLKRFSIRFWVNWIGKKCKCSQQKIYLKTQSDKCSKALLLLATSHQKQILCHNFKSTLIQLCHCTVYHWVFVKKKKTTKNKESKLYLSTQPFLSYFSPYFFNKDVCCNVIEYRYDDVLIIRWK